MNLDFSSINMILLLGVVLFGGTLTGRLFQKLKIPQVVGYNGLGLILGQTGFNIINGDIITSLRPFSTFALGLIGFMIGGELKIQTIKKFGKQFVTILLMESLSAFVVVSILITAVSFIFFKDMKISLSLGLLMGGISSATAPGTTKTSTSPSSSRPSSSMNETRASSSSSSATMMCGSLSTATS